MIIAIERMTQSDGKTKSGRGLPNFPLVLLIITITRKILHFLITCFYFLFIPHELFSDWDSILQPHLEIIHNLHA